MFYTKHNEISDLAEHVNRAVSKLSKRLNEFDSIAVRGTSGLLVGSPVAMMLGKPLIVVRKPGESSHSSLDVEHIGPVGMRVLFLDDFISSGDTKDAVIEAVEGNHRGAKIVAQYMYGWWDDEGGGTRGQWESLTD